MSEKSNLRHAIDILIEAREEVLPLLNAQPALALRAGSVLNRLISGFEVIDGGDISDKSLSSSLKPLKTFMGQSIRDKNSPLPEKPNEAQVNKLREQAEAAKVLFLELSAGKIKEEVSDKIIRAVAKISGMSWVTSTKPEKIDLGFIGKVKKAVQEKADLEAEIANEKAKEADAAQTGAADENEAEFNDRVEILTNLKFVHDPEAKTFRLGEIVIAEADILNEEAWNQTIDAAQDHI